MKAERKKRKGLAGATVGEAFARFIGISLKAAEDDVLEIRKEDEEAKRYVEERRESIQKGARRASKRFRL